MDFQNSIEKIKNSIQIKKIEDGINPLFTSNFTSIFFYYIKKIVTTKDLIRFRLEDMSWYFGKIGNF